MVTSTFSVYFHISKLKTDDDVLVGLHSLFFGRPGTKHLRKKSVLEFSGFVHGSDAEVDRDRQRLSKLRVADLDRLCSITEVGRGSVSKEDKVARLMQFFQAPRRLSEVDLAAREQRKKEKRRRQQDKAPGTAKKHKRGGGHDDDEEEEEEEEDAASDEEFDRGHKKGGKKEQRGATGDTEKQDADAQPEAHKEYAGEPENLPPQDAVELAVKAGSGFLLVLLSDVQPGK